MKINTTQKLTIATAVSAAVVIGLIAAGFILKNKIVVSSMSMRAQIDQINTKRLTLENLRADLSLAKQVKGQVAGYNDFLFPPGHELDLITDMENLAAKNNVTQKIVGSNLDNYTDGKVAISVNVSGAYSDTLKYIHDLENYKYFIAIQHIDFEPSAVNTTSTGPFPASALLQLSLYANPQ